LDPLIKSQRLKRPGPRAAVLQKRKPRGDTSKF
jgi:hypothetical protein